MDTTHPTRPPIAPPDPARPAVVARDDAERARLAELLDRAASHAGKGGPDLLRAVDRVSHRYCRLAVYWRRTPTAIERAAVDLAALQDGLVADHLQPVRAGGASR